MDSSWVPLVSRSVDSRGYLLSGLSKLKNAALLMIIATLLVSVGAFVCVSALFMYVPITSVIHEVIVKCVGTSSTLSAGAASVSIAIAPLAMAVAGLILALIAVYGMLIPAVEDLSMYDVEFSTPSSLIKIGFIVGIILGIVGAATLNFAIGIFLLITAWVFLTIGTVGLAMLCFKINDKLRSGTFIAAGTLFLLSIIPFLTILAFVGWILVYVESNTLMRKVTNVV